MESFDLTSLLKYAKKYKKYILSFILVPSVLVLLISSFLPKTYLAKVVFMPIMGSSSGLDGLESSFSGLLGGGFGLFGPDGSEKKIMAILDSRFLVSTILDTYSVEKYLYPKLWDWHSNTWKSGKKIPSHDAMVRDLKKSISISISPKYKTLNLSVKGPSPDGAVEIASKAMQTLQKIISEKQFSSAKRQRIFIEKQLVQKRKDWLNSGKELADYYDQRRISPSVGKVDADVSIDIVENMMWQPHLGDDLEEHLDDTVVATDESTYAKDIKALKQLGQVTEIPHHVYLQYLELNRQVLNTINSMLAQRYYIAMINETKEEPSFEIIDEARPVGRVSPRPLFNLFISLVITSFVSIFILFTKVFWDEIKKNIKL